MWVEAILSKDAMAVLTPESDTSVLREAVRR
jgi:hypothetical protein